MEKVICFANEKMVQAKAYFMVQTMKIKAAVSNNSGENYVDSAVKILIAVVLGGLLLAGLYALFGDVVLPTLKSRIQGMFNYSDNVYK